MLEDTSYERGPLKTASKERDGGGQMDLMLIHGGGGGDGSYQLREERLYNIFKGKELDHSVWLWTGLQEVSLDYYFFM